MALTAVDGLGVLGDLLHHGAGRAQPPSAVLRLHVDLLARVLPLVCERRTRQLSLGCGWGFGAAELTEVEEPAVGPRPDHKAAAVRRNIVDVGLDAQLKWMAVVVPTTAGAGRVALLVGRRRQRRLCPREGGEPQRGVWARGEGVCVCVVGGSGST